MPAPYYFIDPGRAYGLSRQPLYTPLQNQWFFWVGACHASLVEGRPYLTRTVSDFYGHGLKSIVSVWDEPGWDDIWEMRRPEAVGRPDPERGTHLGRMAVAQIGGRWFAAFAESRNPGDRREIRCMWADHPRDWNPASAEPLGTPDWDAIPGQARGRMDPTILVDDTGIFLLYVGRDAESATTFRARWSGSGWEPEPRPLFAASGCAASLARVTDVVGLGGGREIALVDIAANQDAISRPTAVWVPVPPEGLTGIWFSDELPSLAAPAGASAQYGTTVWQGDELFTFYQVGLGERHRDAQGVLFTSHPRGLVEAAFASASG
jgi:hypothetical protein